MLQDVQLFIDREQVKHRLLQPTQALLISKLLGFTQLRHIIGVIQVAHTVPHVLHSQDPVLA